MANKKRNTYVSHGIGAGLGAIGGGAAGYLAYKKLFPVTEFEREVMGVPPEELAALRAQSKAAIREHNKAFRSAISQTKKFEDIVRNAIERANSGENVSKAYLRRAIRGLSGLENVVYDAASGKFEARINLGKAFGIPEAQKILPRLSRHRVVGGLSVGVPVGLALYGLTSHLLGRDKTAESKRDRLMRSVSLGALGGGAAGGGYLAWALNKARKTTAAVPEAKVPEAIRGLDEVMREFFSVKKVLPLFTAKSTYLTPGTLKSLGETSGRIRGLVENLYRSPHFIEAQKVIGSDYVNKANALLETAASRAKILRRAVPVAALAGLGAGLASYLSDRR